MLNSPHRKTIAPVVIVLRIDIGRIEVQVVGIRSRVERGRPIVAVRPTVVERRIIVVARRGEENIHNNDYHLIRQIGRNHDH